LLKEYDIEENVYLFYPPKLTNLRACYNCFLCVKAMSTAPPPKRFIRKNRETENDMEPKSQQVFHDLDAVSQRPQMRLVRKHPSNGNRATYNRHIALLIREDHDSSDSEHKKSLADEAIHRCSLDWAWLQLKLDQTASRNCSETSM
jgi:hypothetical protein